MAKHHWQLLHFFALMWNDDSYAETGPGARKFLNLWNGLSAKFAATTTAQSAADSFNVLLHRAQRKLRNELNQHIRSSDDQEETALLTSFTKEVRNLDVLQVLPSGCEANPSWRTRRTTMRALRSLCLTTVRTESGGVSRSPNIP